MYTIFPEEYNGSSLQQQIAKKRFHGSAILVIDFIDKTTTEVKKVVGWMRQLEEINLAIDERDYLILSTVESKPNFYPISRSDVDVERGGKFDVHYVNVYGHLISTKVCQDCHGTGKIREGNNLTPSKCPACNGYGRVENE